MDAQTAAMIAARAHEGQTYKGGTYINGHVLEVVNRLMRDPRHNQDALVAAWLHDVIEDTPVTMQDLIAQGLSLPQRNALAALTRKSEEPYGSYISRVCTVPLATLVKYHDLSANIAAGEGCVPKPADIARLTKYEFALERVLEALDTMSGVVGCETCGARIVMMRTVTGSRMPVNRDSLPEVFSRNVEYSAGAGHVSHFATCPQAAQHRRPKR